MLWRTFKMVPFPSPCGKQGDFSLLFTVGTQEPLEMKQKCPPPPGLGPLLFSPLDLVFTEPPAICPPPFRFPCPALAPVEVSAPCHLQRIHPSLRWLWGQRFAQCPTLLNGLRRGVVFSVCPVFDLLLGVATCSFVHVGRERGNALTSL